jgi:mono/diheme cytochrome c family protein
MIEFFYKILTTIGYTHPIHAPTTHIPVGMVIGAFIFGIVSWKFGKKNLARTAHHCITLALIALLPTVIMGIMDWQHYYAGAWLFPIKMKLPLAGLLLILLVFALSVGYRAETISKQALIIYALCLLNVTALGYFGGELAYGGRAPSKLSDTTKVTTAADIEAGTTLYNQTCSACHPNGGNSIKQNLPLKKAPQLVNFDNFFAYIRSPKARDGSKTIMPPFPADKLSGDEARKIYQYIVQVLKKQ